MTSSLGNQSRSRTAQQVRLVGWMQEAYRLHAAGRLGDAGALYEAILAEQPRNAHAIHLLGLLKHQLGQDDEALGLIRQALRMDRGNATIYLNLAAVLRRLGQIDEARAAYLKAIKLNPTLNEARIGYGILLNEGGQFADAIRQFDKVLASNRASIEALTNRGNALRRLGRHAAALESYDAALAIDQHNAGANYNRGIALQDLGRHAEALANYGVALATQPTFVLAHASRGTALQALRRPDEALASFDRALELDAGHVTALVGRGNVLRDLNRPTEALASFDRALALDPASTSAGIHRGDLLKDLGRLKDAEDSFAAAIALNPASGAGYHSLAQVRRFVAGDPVIARMQGLLGSGTAIPAAERARIAYALGKAFDDVDDPARAFEHYTEGARLTRGLLPYDEAASAQLFERIEAVFTPEFLAANAGQGDPSRRPIFILGMPRSGTSLLEQILSRHPQVCAAGELAAFNGAVNLSEQALGGSFPEVVTRFLPSHFQALGAAYLDAISRISPDAARVTDKMPSNFFFLGLIRLAFPNARIIHTTRDPIDTCVSCYSILFAEPQPYSYDLGELGRYHRRYQALMAHWRRVLPADSFLDVAYEDVVADLETATHRILDFCGLPWDDACLSFQESRHVVRTASAAQVRQPIYSRSVGRWKRYAAYLGPLLAALADDPDRAPT